MKTHAWLAFLLVLTTSVAAAQDPAAAPVRSIRQWVKGDGVTDDALGVAKAFDEAKNKTFTLLVDCPVVIHVGTDAARPIFVESGTDVRFTGDGLFIVDNVTIPTFVLASSTGVRFTDWRVEYVGGYPIDPRTGSYYQNGVAVVGNGATPAAAAFNDLTLLAWLTAHRGVVFDPSKGRVKSPWGGPVVSSAIFYLSGDVRDLVVDRMKLFVPPDAKASHFIPICFSLIHGYNSNQTITAQTPFAPGYASIPHHLTFSNVDIDGYYFGWLGSLADSVFEKIHARRYSDLQDDRGENVGGKGKWFAPPHLFYLTNDSPIHQLPNRNLRLVDVVDDGIRVGNVRDQGASDTISGYAPSLKIAADDSVVTNYRSYRPDGFLDILPSTRLTISEADATYDSAFLNHLYPAIRFPGSGYKDVTVQDVTLRDTAPHPVMRPILGTKDNESERVVFKNVRVTLNEWKNVQDVRPTFTGPGNVADIRYHLLDR